MKVDNNQKSIEEETILKTNNSMKKIEIINADNLELDLKSISNENDKVKKKESEKNVSPQNNKTNKERKLGDKKKRKSKNEYYAMTSPQNIKGKKTYSLDNKNFFFVFPHNKNVVDLKKKNHSLIKHDGPVSEDTCDAKNSNSYKQSIKFCKNVDERKRTKKKKKKNSLTELENPLRETRQFRLMSSFKDCPVNEYLVEINNCVSQRKSDNEENKLYTQQSSRKKSSKSSIDTDENKEKTNSAIFFGKNDEHTEKNTGEENLVITKDTSETQNLTNENGEDENKEEKENEEKEDEVKEGKGEGEDEKEKVGEKEEKEEKEKEEKKEDKLKEEKDVKPQTEEQEYVTYKVPKYLKNKKITCPFKYKSVFFGKYGIINYDLKGKENNVLVITFHGLNGTNITFTEIQNILIRYKFQVLNFDLYGYGLSACPKYIHKARTYGLEFFVSQTEELLNFLNLQNKKFYLIGFSMGCVIATAFAKKYINQVKKILFISPVGMLEKKPFLLKMLKIFPCFIKCSSYFVQPCFISKKKFRHIDKEGDSSDYLYNRIMWQLFVKKNITHSILGCLNNLKLWSSHELFKEVGLSTIPVLIVCGKKDNFCNTNVFQKIEKCFANSHLIIFENASHLLFVEKQQELIACILTFFHFPLDHTNMNVYHYMLPIDREGNYVVKEKRFSLEYKSFKSYLEDIDYVPNIFISFIDKEQEYEMEKKNKLRGSIDDIPSPE